MNLNIYDPKFGNRSVWVDEGALRSVLQPPVPLHLHAPRTHHLGTMAAMATGAVVTGAAATKEGRGCLGIVALVLLLICAPAIPGIIKNATAPDTDQAIAAQPTPTPLVRVQRAQLVKLP